MSDDDCYCDVDDPDFFTEDHMERYFVDEDEPPIQVIQMGVTAPYNPNRLFAASLAGRREAREYQKKINKTLPLPRNRK